MTLGPLPESRLRPGLWGPNEIEPLPSSPLICLQNSPTHAHMHTHPPRTSLPQDSWLPQLICHPPTGNLRIQRLRKDGRENWASMPGPEEGSHRSGRMGPAAQAAANPRYRCQLRFLASRHLLLQCPLPGMPLTPLCIWLDTGNLSPTAPFPPHSVLALPGPTAPYTPSLPPGLIPSLVPALQMLTLASPGLEVAQGQGPCLLSLSTINAHVGWAQSRYLPRIG